jgi:flagellar motor switch protein FliN/FliY
MSSSPNSSSSFEAGAPELRPFHDVVCDIDIVLGTGSMTVRDCLHLKRQSVIRLTQAAGDDLQVVVNGVPIALGEVVIVEDSTAIRVSEILPPSSTEVQS